MKKLITILAALLPLTLAAQGHLKFEGITIDGTISEFSQELVEKGLTFMEKDGLNYIFTDRTETTDNGYVIVNATPEDKGALVYQVMRMTPPSINFNELEKEYKKQQRKLDALYGEGEYDEYIDPSFDTDEMARYFAIQRGKGKYVTQYNTQNGQVTLTITPANKLGYVAVLYIDMINYKKAEKYLDE